MNHLFLRLYHVVINLAIHEAMECSEIVGFVSNILQITSELFALFTVGKINDMGK